MKSEELKGCPFCGGAARMLKTRQGSGKDWYFVLCEECGATSDDAASTREAAEKWNRRTEGEHGQDA